MVMPCRNCAPLVHGLHQVFKERAYLWARPIIAIFEALSEGIFGRAVSPNALAWGSSTLEHGGKRNGEDYRPRPFFLLSVRRPQLLPLMDADER
jgi:hypothetical protein